MNTNQKILVFAIIALVFCVLSTVAYNVFERRQAAELYRECLALRDKLAATNPNNLNWCYLR